MYYGVAAYTTLRYWQKQQGYRLRPRKRRLQEQMDGEENSIVLQSARSSQEQSGSLAATEAAAEDREASVGATAMAGTSAQVTVADERVGLVDIEAAPEIAEEPNAEITKQNIASQIAESPTVLHQLTLATQQVLYESFTCFAPLVTIVYWGLLYPTQSVTLDTPVDLWTGISMHAVNSVLMVVEVGVFAKSPYTRGHFWILFVFLALYLGLAYFMVGVYDFYVYPFFDPKYFGGYVALICLLAVNIVAIVWVIMLMLHRVRDSVYPRWLLKRSETAAAIAI
ncbi:hypothetical protein H4R20_000670 [Coemansia guatemalensis]|uniref:Transmembrane protein n=1 Tax=Coemansia guatemalensis TaxID=2761395 RepID=A0A9W8LTY1_9FUNG|nr:hypothetical protein H4R20_000670 [Coemansia guatemalensis]